MKLISWNVNGLRAVVSKNAFEWLDEHKPDFLALQEIKAKQDDIPAQMYNLGFSEINSNSAQKAGYSGVMSLSKFQTSCLKSQFFDDTEGRVLEHRFGDIVLFNIYFPNGQKDDERLKHKMDFYAAFLKYCNEILDSGKHVIFCGDVNTAHQEIDLKNPKANSKTSGFLPIERAWIDEVLSNGFIDTFRHFNPDKIDAYSWWSYRFGARAKNVGWRIDYFFVSQGLKDRLKNAFILSDIIGSDHCPVGIEIDI
ncbi:exodeoxyribonuclease III (exonuclease III) [Campylobacter pinnipediorum subsp. caledonicus]|uniref:Exodeoxyribonuclease III (Exonuclease III) n=1 Tax=Campylobacter pinnipediorum subsp. caledonicus TaxID=1874362 RepID=A0A1S6U8J2_9BACT|nr:exodeoxyribonuclease III [Campylobacter pinnipediorum]AQW86381.1 exodeoxyribonuclease III (exonuclease III) [Campylobacter pinnipediorum subsp. caledonicus]AQW88033.1 exodeoxyribonuclease III (exonuclease III) [Campylobacter pinnipediorum subsp. caledonicus]OPA71478.1 exodeoxyribonuclease III [Campylobacter pinnipediorum subsp. caledonicus]